MGGFDHQVFITAEAFDTSGGILTGVEFFVNGSIQEWISFLRLSSVGLRATKGVTKFTLQLKTTMAM